MAILSQPLLTSMNSLGLSITFAIINKYFGNGISSVSCLKHYEETIQINHFHY